MIYLTNDGHLIFEYRDVADSESTKTFSTGNLPYQWIKIQRKGQDLTGYYSADGKTWKARGSCSIAMNQTVYAGMAIAEVAAGSGVSASWDNITIARQSDIEVVPSSGPDFRDTRPERSRR